MDHEQYLLNSPSNVTMDSGHSELGFCALDIMPCLFNRSSGFEKPERKKISDRKDDETMTLLLHQEHFVLWQSRQQEVRA